MSLMSLRARSIFSVNNGDILRVDSPANLLKSHGHIGV